MIHVELSVAPHAKNCQFDGVTLKPGSPPPHTIIHRQFSQWDEVRRFVAELGLKVDGLDFVCCNPNNEYVQVELEVKEVTGQEYTAACLSIEGRAEETLWDEARRVAHLLDAWNLRVAQDTNTHDGEPRGEAWDEGSAPAYGNGYTYTNVATRLRNLADLWENG